MIRKIFVIGLLFFLAFAVLPVSVSAQDADNPKRITFKNAPLASVLRLFAKRARINLLIVDKISEKVTIDFIGEFDPLKLLRLLANSYGYELVQEEDNVYKIRKKRKIKLDKKTFILRNLRVEKIEAQVKSLLSADGKFIGNKETNAFLIIDTKDNIERIAEFIKVMDNQRIKEEGDPKKDRLRKNFQLKLVAVKKVEGKLRQFLSKDGELNISEENNAIYVIDYEENMKKIEDYVNFLNKPRKDSFDALAKVKIFRYDRLTKARVEEGIKGLLSDQGKVTVDENKKVAVVRDFPDVFPRIEKYLKEADKPAKQVYIRCHFIEVIYENRGNFGASFNTKNPAFNIDDVDFTEPTNGAGQQWFDFTNVATITGVDIANKDDLFINLRAGATNRSVRLLSSPNLLCTNGKTAKIEIIRKIPYQQTQTDTDSSTGTTTTQTTVEFEEIGIVLEVTPVIYSDGYVELNVKPDVGELEELVSVGSGGNITEAPQTRRKRVDATVNIKSGQTIVIGGLLQDRVTKTRQKVPFLGDIPLLGLLFSGSDEVVEKNELIIFLHVLVVNDEELQALTRRAWNAQRQHHRDMDREFSFFPHLTKQLDLRELNYEFSFSPSGKKYVKKKK